MTRMSRALMTLAACQLAAANMKFGKDEDDDRVRTLGDPFARLGILLPAAVDALLPPAQVHKASEDIKCSMCMVLVEDMWGRANGEPGIGEGAQLQADGPPSAASTSHAPLHGLYMPHALTTAMPGAEEGTGVAIRKEDEMLQLVQDACGTDKNWAPPFTQVRCFKSPVLDPSVFRAGCLPPRRHAGLRDPPAGQG